MNSIHNPISSSSLHKFNFAGFFDIKEYFNFIEGLIPYYVQLSLFMTNMDSSLKYTLK